MPRCPFIDVMVVDVVGDALIVRREFVEVFRVGDVREIGDGLYAVSISSLPEPLRSYIEAYHVRMPAGRGPPRSPGGGAGAARRPRVYRRRVGRETPARRGHPGAAAGCGGSGSSGGGGEPPRSPRDISSLRRLLELYGTTVA